MRKIILVLLSAFVASTGYAQSVAKDFTLKDCSGSTKHLFSELDEGKVIVITWVMPCFSCIGPALSASNIVKSYADSDPGKVLHYLVDDYGNTSCPSLNSWANQNSITANSFFSNSMLKMSDYGSDGMPKIVVVGGPLHKVYYNHDYSLGGDPNEIKAAIDLALTESVGIENIEPAETTLSVYPNPAKDFTYVAFNVNGSENIAIEVLNILGENIEFIQLGELETGEHKFELNTTSYSNGIYFLKIGTRMTRFIVAR